MTFTSAIVALSIPEKDVTPKACKGWLCLSARPDDEDAYGWQDGYCRECQAELAKQEAGDAEMRRGKEEG
jgi:hypothetical protein